jgi:hypothetical protein
LRTKDHGGKRLDTKDKLQDKPLRTLAGSLARLPTAGMYAVEVHSPTAALTEKAGEGVSGPERHRILVRIVGNHMLLDGPKSRNEHIRRSLSVEFCEQFMS